MRAKPGAAARAAAARVVAGVLSGRSLDAVLPAQQARFVAADRALVAALAYGVLRDYRLLDALAGQLLTRPPKSLVRTLILVGLQQLRGMRVPAHAAVSATVAACGELGQPRARGLVNAVLRRFQREQEALEAALPDAPGLRSSHPDWLVTRLRADWPEDWQELLPENNRPAPMTLRVNRRQTDRVGYLAELEAAGLIGRPHAFASDAVVLDAPCPVAALPGFADGRVSVQDAAAQLAAPLLDIRPGMRVLDACAAPGGKAAHCLELADCELLALDADQDRLAAVDESFARLGLAAQTRQADAAAPGGWWDGRPFDRILVDAPCSGTGVIRRHPDIKWLRRESDIAALAQRQRALLDGLWPVLGAGGVLIYASCSTLRAEGAEVVGDFVVDTPDAGEQPLPAGWGRAESVGRRIAPGETDMDGFYYARLRKGQPP